MKRLVLALILLTAVAATAIGSAQTATTRATTVATGTSSLGRILVDGQGRTLYLFEKDRRGRSACGGVCAAYWPPLLARGKVLAADGAKQSLLGVSRRADGRSQVTYAGHPLYRFAQDTRRGQTAGQDLQLFGAGWYVLSPRGVKIEEG